MRKYNTSDGLLSAGFQHIHRRYFCFHHYDANGSPRGMLPRRHRVSHLLVPTLVVPGRQEEDQRIRRHRRRREKGSIDTHFLTAVTFMATLRSFPCVDALVLLCCRAHAFRYR